MIEHCIKRSCAKYSVKKQKSISFSYLYTRAHGIPKLFGLKKLSAQKWLSEKSLLELMRTSRVIKGKMPENQSNSLLLMGENLMGIFKVA